MKDILKCPVCGEALVKSGRSYSCQNQHSFDQAKEGYLNLLLNAKPNSGDSKEMMQARRDFLKAGYYQPISDAVNEILVHQTKANDGVADVGCGEGYYLSRFQDLYPQNTNLYGLDISKIGIKMASKSNKKIHWLVSNFTQLPFADKSVDLILSMFSEYKVTEFERILNDSGKILIARAGKEHLQELKSVIYPEYHEKLHASEIKEFPNFDQESHSLTYQTTVFGKENLLHLLAMTPHYWKIRPEGRARLEQLEELTVTIDISLYLLK